MTRNRTLICSFVFGVFAGCAFGQPPEDVQKMRDLRQYLSRPDQLYARQPELVERQERIDISRPGPDKYARDGQGNVIYDYSIPPERLISLLIRYIDELERRITALESNGASQVDER